MKFRDFKNLDPALADRFLQTEQYRQQVGDWQQTCRDQIQRRLEELGKAEPEIVYKDANCTAFRSLLNQAEGINDPVLSALVEELKDPNLFQPSDNILDEIFIKHRLTVGTSIDDYENIEDAFEFITVYDQVQ